MKRIRRDYKNALIKKKESGWTAKGGGQKDVRKRKKITEKFFQNRRTSNAQEAEFTEKRRLYREQIKKVKRIILIDKHYQKFKKGKRYKWILENSYYVQNKEFS